MSELIKSNMTKQAIIDVKGLQKSFGNHIAVNNMSLTINQGDIFGFLGPNGSGKTTTMRMLCGLLTPDHVEGHCLNFNLMTDTHHIKPNIGYMAQHFSLYEDLTVVENLDFISRVYQIPDRKKRIEEALKLLSIGEKRQQQLVKTLSGGWKQRLALAAVVLHRPKLLLLDEPTAGVDPQARRHFWNAIHELAHQGVTALVSTHYMDEAERCHRLAYILHGNLLTTGTADEIIKDAALYTLEITGPNLSLIHKKLESNTNIKQIAAFGNTLHVTDHDLTQLKQHLSEQIGKSAQYKEVTTSLEDVFIHLMQEHEHQGRQHELA